MSSGAHFDRVRTRWLPLWVIAAMLLLLPFKQRMPQWGRGRAFDLMLQYAIYAALVLWTLQQRRRAEVPLRRLLGPFPRAWTEWRLVSLALPLIPLAIGSVFLLWIPLSFLVPDLVQQLVLRRDEPIWVSAAPIRSSFAVVLVVFVAPVVEEIIFRGILLHRWAQKWGAGRGLLFSSLAFGVLHADILGHTVFGIVMGLLYVRTRGLWVPIACHLFTNAFAVVGQALSWGVNNDVYTLARFREEWYFGALALAVAIPLLYAMRSRYLPPRSWQLPLAQPMDLQHVPEEHAHVPQH